MAANYLLSLKDLLEFKYWCTADIADHHAKIEGYREAFEIERGQYFESCLEIGCGPLLGLLALIESPRKVAVDPLLYAYEDSGLMVRETTIQKFNQPFERWSTAHPFSAIFCADALDHGEMGFYLIPKIADLLKPGGRFYLHVHLRPQELINLVHDHQLIEEQLDKELARCGLREIRRTIYEHDVDGKFCQALVGVWQKP